MKKKGRKREEEKEEGVGRQGPWQVVLPGTISPVWSCPKRLAGEGLQ